VHGYATDFGDAARRAGQLALDMDLDVAFGGLPMLYSWPSLGTTAGYLSDYDTSVSATQAFNRFLDLVKRDAGVSRVHIIAHSMGNWMVANALRDRALRGSDQFLDELVLAAPDIPATNFREAFLAVLPQLARRVTLYVSDHDKALETSARFRAGTPRAGLLDGGLMKERAPRFDVVDATSLPAGFLDHSYYATNESMLSDMYCLLRGSPANGRPLITSAGVNWRFRPRDELATRDAAACAPADLRSPGAVTRATAGGHPAASTWPWRRMVYWAGGIFGIIVAAAVFRTFRRRS
jgi:esterase/lipase superfamily enzyme